MTHPELKMEHWFQSPPGLQLLDLEAQHLAGVIGSCRGKHLVQIGGPKAPTLRTLSTIKHQSYLTSHENLLEHSNLIVSRYDELALLPESVDLILLPHVLEFTRNPMPCLKQIYQALRPEATLIIFSFNPRGVGALWRLQSLNHHLPWRARWWPPYRLKEWLQLIGFTEIRQHSLCHQPWVSAKGIKSIRFLDEIGAWLCPNSGAVSVLLAKKHVLSPLLRPAQWRAQVAGACAGPGVRNWHEQG